MTIGSHDEQPSAWDDAILVADLLALDPGAMVGVVVHGFPGPARDAWLARVRDGLSDEAPMLRVPCNCSADRLLGGLELTATLAIARRVFEPGVLAKAHGGIAVLAMAERWAPASAALVTSVLDRCEISIERDGFAACSVARFGVIALDESQADEQGPPQVLVERLAFRIDLDGVRLTDLVEELPTRVENTEARRVLAQMAPIDPGIVRSLCRAAWELGIGSLRVPGMALAVARAHAALVGRARVTSQDAAVAARLVFVSRATRYPDMADQPDQSANEPEPQNPANAETETAADAEASDGRSPEDVVLSAVQAALPKGLLELNARRDAAIKRGGGDGRAGVQRKSLNRGRVIGVRAISSARAARLNVLATLQTAAPWQTIRRRGQRSAGGAHVLVRREDFRTNRYKHRSGTMIVFAVDASGSAALHRLAEAKGAVELLLAECYARRDSVALVAFRGKDAEVRLPPSRSLLRAKRSLAGLPGGGGTPLSAGLDAASDLAISARRKGDTPLVVILTDGRANVARDGKGGRPAAELEALQAARYMLAQQLTTVFLDTSPQPNPFAKRLAAEMGGRYIALPVAGAEAISAAVQRERVSSQA